MAYRAVRAGADSLAACRALRAITGTRPAGLPGTLFGYYVGSY